jgi:hypothetical protein
MGQFGTSTARDWRKFGTDDAHSRSDQVFMSFLVTPVPSGGLGLKASNYAALVAAMVRPVPPPDDLY